MKYKIKKPTDDKLRKQINIANAGFFLFYILSWICIIFGEVTETMFGYAMGIFFIVLFALAIISQKLDKIRLEIRELKR